MENEAFRFFLFRYGRAKESYYEIFSSQEKKSIDEFIVSFRSSLVDTVKEILNQEKLDKTHLKKVSDFDIIIKALEKFDAFQSNFNKHQPGVTVVFEIPPDSSLIKADIHCQNPVKINTYQVIVHLWDGFYEDTVDARLFLTPDNERFNLNAVFENLTEELNASVHTESISKSTVLSQIKSLGITEIPMGEIFWGCSHSLSPYFEEILGTELYTRIKNEPVLTVLKNRENDAGTTIDDDAELPF
jgi:hypothetical protein